MTQRVPPEMFLLFCLTQPMTRQGQEMVREMWTTWFRQWLAAMGVYNIEVTSDPDDATKVRATFNIQGMPEQNTLFTVPVPDSPYEVHVVSKISTGCSLRAPAGHCPACRHAHRLEPTGLFVCAGPGSQCTCIDDTPCHCPVCAPSAPAKEG